MPLSLRKAPGSGSAEGGEDVEIDVPVGAAEGGRRGAAEEGGRLQGDVLAELGRLRPQPRLGPGPPLEGVGGGARGAKGGTYPVINGPTGDPADGPSGVSRPTR